MTITLTEKELAVAVREYLVSRRWINNAASPPVTFDAAENRDPMDRPTGSFTVSATVVVKT